MAAVAVSDSPAGPFRMTGAFRMPNRTDYQACTQYAVPGQARDMTVFQDDDGTAYISYSSEENYSLYVAELDDSYTNVTHTTDRDTLNVRQYSEDGRFPYIFDDGSPAAPERGKDFQIVKECGHLEAPAIFERDGTYSVVTSGATGWAPNPQTYYTAGDLMGTWIRGVDKDDANETVSYNAIPDGARRPALDRRRAPLDVRLADHQRLRARTGQVRLHGRPLERGQVRLDLRMAPAHGGRERAPRDAQPRRRRPRPLRHGVGRLVLGRQGLRPRHVEGRDHRLPETVRRGAAPQLPTSVPVDTAAGTAPVAVTWSSIDTSVLGPQTITGTLAADADFTAGRSFQRTITVAEPGIADIAPEATVTASSRNDLVATLTDGNATAKGWDDWTGNGYPRDSWLQFDWGTDRTFDSIVVHTYKDGATATWPPASRCSTATRPAHGETPRSRRPSLRMPAPRPPWP